MNDLRARLERVVAKDAPRGRPAEVEGRRVSREERPGGCDAAHVDGPTSERPPTRGHVGRPSATAPGFETHERRIALAELGLGVVGRGAPDPKVVMHLGLRGEPPSRWEDVLFLDTETTGLSGGTGTYVFMLGTAHLADGELVVRQHVLHDLARERAFVSSIRTELERFRACASYNGKSFDLPLLRARFVMALRADLTVDDAHLDLLHPARRLWRGRFGSTTLRQLEESVLDDGRTDDIPGSLIPERYFAYLAHRDPDLLRPIFAHNLRDLTSLVRITDLVAEAVIAARAGRAPDHAPAAYALARVFERTGEPEAAFCCYESAYVDGDLELRARLALAFARILERRGELERALRMLEMLLDLGQGTASWRLQAEARVRRLTRKKWRSELRPAS